MTGAGSGGCKKEMPRIRGESEPALQGSEETEREMGVRDRVGQTNEKVWLGSYDTEKEAALAFDAGKYHCSSKRSRSFNFSGSPNLLGPVINLRDLSSKERKKTIQQVAENHAKKCASIDL